jgi:SAM-dependent methyltransferase
MHTTAIATSHPAEAVADKLMCPGCLGKIIWDDRTLACSSCGAAYAVRRGILDLRPEDAQLKAEAADWSEHWSADKQAGAVQKFFSFYRKAIFARSVAHFISRHFPAKGVFLEAGSGTAETSMRVDKKNGGRTLVALDLIPAVLDHCHPVMDIRVSGDIFRLPFKSGSLDGIWNVGVMEHFPHEQIDLILKEFNRVLKPGGRIVLLWPATFSLPQRLLRVVEWFVNRNRTGEKFRFHPDEISQLKSIRQGREVLTRNGFSTVAIDWGLRTGLAFETLFGEKRKIA